MNRRHAAAKPNPALAALEPLVGTWRTVGRHPYLPGRTLHGTAVIEWIEGGAFLMMRTTTEAPEIPDGLAILGSDDALGHCFMLYFDERGVSRQYEVTLSRSGLEWSRDDPKFAQRFSIAVAPDGATLAGRGEMSREGGPWEPDLEVTYTRE